MSRNPQQQKLISIVEPVLEAAGFELVDLRFVLEQGGWTLRVQVDLPLDDSVDPHDVPTDRVDLEDCENLSRELSAVLDVEDPIPQAYALEVGSPGIDRPLRTARHFAYFAGSEAKIQLAHGLPAETGTSGTSGTEGTVRKNFRGVLKGVEGEGEDAKVVIDVDGQPFQLPIADIDTAKLVPDWDAVMKGKSGVGAPQPRPVKPGGKVSKHKSSKTREANKND